MGRSAGEFQGRSAAPKRDASARGGARDDAHSVVAEMCAHFYAQIPFALWVVDPEGVALDCNPRFLETAAVDRSAVVGRDMRSDPLGLSVAPLLARALAGARASAECTVQLGGRRVRCRHTLQPIIVDGRLGCVLGILEDLGERGFVAEASPQHPRDLALLSHTATELMAVGLDDDLCRRIAELLREIVGRAVIVANLFHPESDSLETRAVVGVRPVVRQALARLNQDPVGRLYLARQDALEALHSAKLVRVDGGVYELSFGRMPRPVASMLERVAAIGEIYSMGFVWQGQLLGSVVILMHRGCPLESPHLVEAFVRQAAAALLHRQAAEALRESEERLRLLTDTVSDVIWTADLDLRLTYVSPAVRALIGTPPGQEASLAIADLLGEDGVSRLRGALGPGQHGVKPRSDLALPPVTLETERRRADGTSFWMEVRVHLLRDRHGAPIGVAGVTRDVSDRKRAQERQRLLDERIRQSQKLESLRALAGGVAHDFNNILTAIMGNASLALTHLDAASETHALVSEVEEAATRAAALSLKLLAYSGGGTQAVDPLDLSRVVRDAWGTLESLAGEHAALSLELDPAPPLVLGDARQIREMICTLVVNAAEAIGPQPGSIRVRTGTLDADETYLATTVLEASLKAGTCVFIEVADTGCGIDMETRSRLFEPFFTTKFMGRGLGLAALLGMMRAHGGTVDVKTEPGHGSTFRLLFAPHRPPQ